MRQRKEKVIQDVKSIVYPKFPEKGNGSINFNILTLYYGVGR
jgi:hypothetical protein